MYVSLGLILGVEAGVVQVSFCTDDNELKLVRIGATCTCTCISISITNSETLCNSNRP